MLPDNDGGSRVIVTTRFAHIHSVMPLSVGDSYTLFCKKTFQGILCPPHLEEFQLES